MVAIIVGRVRNLQRDAARLEEQGALREEFRLSIPHRDRYLGLWLGRDLRSIGPQTGLLYRNVS